MARSVKEHLGKVLARRRLREVGGARRWLTIHLGNPRYAGRNQWLCPFHFSAVVRPAADQAYGRDAFQALILALEGIRHALDRTRLRFTWNDRGIGETGFHLLVPTYLHGRFTRRFERVLTCAIVDAARDGAKMALRRQRPPRASKRRRSGATAPVQRRS